MKKLIHKKTGVEYAWTPILCQRDDMEEVECPDEAPVEVEEKPKRKKAAGDEVQEPDQDF